MQTADEMFKELGYKKIVGETTEVYKLSRANKNIYFSKLIKRIKIDGKYDFLDMEELRAINKKCKELGWIDNKNTIPKILDYADNPLV